MGRENSPTVPMSDEMKTAIESQLRYGDSRAEWIREAIRQRLKRDGILDSEAVEQN